jgi:hypothetical protein
MSKKHILITENLSLFENNNFIPYFAAKCSMSYFYYIQ